jgi:hypothetical protein
MDVPAARQSPLRKSDRFLAGTIPNRYNPHLHPAYEEICMFREENETLSGVRTKLDELRRYL